ncbi:MAG: hypothetical protein HY583_00785, partial [Candidatus Omnitrophica bacterium]|nr:hypothetical protein [Candidatus Omnitrophota bacterium]
MNHFSISYPRRQNLEMIHHKKLVTIEDYELYIGTEAVDQILQKAKRFKDLRIADVNSTYYGGGVA